MNRAAVLAVDGGNSKTDVALVNSGGSVLALVRGALSSPQHLGVDGRPILEATQLGDVDDLVDLLERVLEAGQLRDALGERHLTALEAQAEALASRVLAFLAATRRLAATRAGAASDALAALA